MKRKIALALACLMLFPLCSGCQDAHEADNWAYAYLIGVDKGVSDAFRYSIVVPTMKGRAGSGSGSGQTEQQQVGDKTMISVDCPTLYEGLDLISTFLSRRINYMHCKFMVISEDLAKQSVIPIMEGARYARQVRLNMHVIVVKGQASDFIKGFNPPIGTSLPKTQEGLMAASENTGLIDRETYMDMLSDLKSSKKQASCTLAAINDNSTYLPPGKGTDAKNMSGGYYPGQIPRTGGNKTEFLGTAVFLGDMMVGELNAEETRALTMVRGTLVNAIVTIQDPLNKKYYVSTIMSKNKKQGIKIDLSGEKPVINVRVYLQGDIINQQSEIGYQDQEHKSSLEKAYENYIRGKIEATIKKCQGLGSDIFGFGEVASTQFWTVKGWENYGWLKKFKDAEIHTEVKLTIKGTGIGVKTNPIKRQEGTD